MKTKIKNIKYLIIWIITWLSLISFATYAYTTQAGKIGSLFVKITSTSWDDTAWEYRLDGKNIKDNTVDNSEIYNSGTYELWKLWIWISNPSQKLQVNWNIAIKDNDTQLQKGANNSLRIRTNHWYVDIWPMNWGYSHFQTDRGQFYFNKKIIIDSWKIASYNWDLQLQTSENHTKLTIKNNNWNVWIWTTSPSQKLDVNWNIKWWKSILSTDQWWSIELWSTWTPYIDFKNNLSDDYDGRIILTWDNELRIDWANLKVPKVKTTCIWNCY